MIDVTAALARCAAPARAALLTVALGVFLTMLSALTASLAFATSRQYESISSFRFHNQLQWAVKDGKDGLVVAFLDGHSPYYVEEEQAYNEAAASFGCLPTGGTHALLTSEDERAQFIATDLQEIYSLPETAVPPVAVYFENEKPVSWTSGNASALPSPDGADANWTTGAIAAWAYSLFNVSIVRSTSELEAFHAASAERMAVGFFPRLCDGEAKVYKHALALYKQRHGGESLPAAISTNTTLGHDACAAKVSKAEGGVCAFIGERGARLTMPPDVERTAVEMAQWLEGITAPNRDKAEL